MATEIYDLIRAWRAGKDDLRATLPDVNGPRGRYSPRSIRQIDTIVVHHTASSKDTTWRSVYDLHTRVNEWSGTGYHFGIRHGRISYLGDVGTSRACVASENHHIICVCVTGDYTKEAVSPEDQLSLTSLIEDIQGWALNNLGRKFQIKVHGDMGQTACPGPALRAVAESIARGDTQAPPGMPTDEPSKEDIAATVARREIEVNKQAALFVAMNKAGFFPVGEETRRSGWVMQLAASRVVAPDRVFYCRDGDWGNVKSKTV